jgi:hypothetical protein
MLEERVHDLVLYQRVEAWRQEWLRKLQDMHGALVSGRLISDLTVHFLLIVCRKRDSLLYKYSHGCDATVY